MMRSVLIGLISFVLSAGAAFAQGTPMPVPRQTWLTNNGAPAAGYWVCVYAAGTTTAAITYSTAALTIANSNPVILDSAGRGTVFLSPGNSYKFVLKSPSSPVNCNMGTVIWSVDHVTTVPTGNVAVDIDGVAGETIAAGEAVYLSDGSGSKTAGLWYLADSDFTYSSTTPWVGISTVVMETGETGAIRTSGLTSGLSALSLGQVYYIGPTPGQLTTAAPANRRGIGQAQTVSTMVVDGNPAPLLQPPTGTGTVETFLRGDNAWSIAFSPVCDCRLSLTTTVPVTTADITGATTIYLEPYKGNRIALYNATVWTLLEFAEISIAVPATTATMYDLYVFNNAGVAQLEALAWTNDTTRATALVYVDGVPMKTGDTTRRYVGSFRTTAVSGETEDSFANRLLWNYNHRVGRAFRVLEGTNSWTYNSATWRQANAATANQVNVVVGVQEAIASVTIQAFGRDTSAQTFSIAVGVNSTTVPTFPALAQGDGSAIMGLATTVTVYPAAGYSFLAWLESGSGTPTTFFGDNGGTVMQAGISGMIEG